MSDAVLDMIVAALMLAMVLSGYLLLLSSILIHDSSRDSRLLQMSIQLSEIEAKIAQLESESGTQLFEQPEEFRR